MKVDSLRIAGSIARFTWFTGLRGRALPLLAALLVGVTGCAEAYDQPAAYPESPAPDASYGSASLEANPPNPSAAPPEIAIGVDQKTYADTDPTALTEFRSTLEPYGTWVEDPNYGVVWQPSAKVVGADFTPYVSAGHWVYDDDWVWVSDYSWGWAPFHYGRWVNIGGRGWAWIPGRTYRGAWVTWRVGYGEYDYLGWAPMAPTWYWRGGYAVGFYVAPTPTYYYCPHRDVFSPVVATRMVPPGRVPAIASNTRPYLPSDPQIAGSRAVSVPTVGGAGARSPARPVVGNGPSPTSLGLADNAVVRPAAADPGLTRARAFAMPSSAVAVGARPPQGFPTPPPEMRSPQVGAAVARPGGPVVASPRPGALPNYGPSPRSYASPSWSSPSAVSRPSYSPSPSFSRPSYSSSPVFRPSSPTFRPSPSVSAPYRSPTYSPPSPPMFHHSPSPGFGGGGFHGGGGGGGHMGGSPSVGGGGGGGRAVGRPR